MAASITKFRAAHRGAERSTERAALAAAIRRVAAATEEIERVKAARAKLGPIYRSDVDRAEEALAEARDREPRRVVDELLGRDGQDGPSVAEASAALADAKREEARRRQVVALLDEESARADRELSWAEMDRERGVAEVVKAEALPAVMAEYERALKRCAALDAVVSNLPGRPRVWGAPLAPEPGIAVTWRAALAALAVDPDAGFPEF